MLVSAAARGGRNPVRHNLRRSVDIDAAEVLCTLAGSNAIGFIYGDFADGGALPFTVTLSTGDSFVLNTPFNPGLDTGFIGFVSDTRALMATGLLSLAVLTRRRTVKVEIG